MGRHSPIRAVRSGLRLAAERCRALADAAQTRARVGPVTLRLLLGLDRPTAGSATIDGRPFASVGTPLRQAIRAAVGSGIYLALMALFAAGLAALLRSGVAVLSVLIPLLLLVPFIFTDFASGVGSYLPNQAGQLVVQQYPQGPVGPWAGLGVTALWACAAVLAGWVAVSRRDA